MKALSARRRRMRPHDRRVAAGLDPRTGKKDGESYTNGAGNTNVMKITVSSKDLVTVFARGTGLPNGLAETRL